MISAADLRDAIAFVVSADDVAAGSRTRRHTFARSCSSITPALMRRLLA